MSHFTLLAQFTEEESNKILSYSTDSVRYQAMQNLLEEKLLPFKEGTSDLPEQYKEFCVAATVEELEQEFKVGKFSVLKDHDGRELPYSEKTYVEYYKTLDNYIKEYHGYKKHNGEYGYWRNPNAKWDWWQIGGRWSCSLRRKPQAVSGVNQEHIDYIKKNQNLYGDYKFKNNSCDWCLTKDYDHEADCKSAEEDIDEFISDYYKFIEMENSSKPWEEYTKEEKEFQNNHFYYGERLARLGIRTVVKVREPIYNQDGTPTGEFSKPVFQDIAFDKNFLMEKKYMFEFSTYAILTESGEWIAPGEMGWFGASSESNDDVDLFKKNYKSLAFKNPNSIICVVDCHI